MLMQTHPPKMVVARRYAWEGLGLGLGLELELTLILILNPTLTLILIWVGRWMDEWIDWPIGGITEWMIE